MRCVWARGAALGEVTLTEGQKSLSQARAWLIRCPVLCKCSFIDICCPHQPASQWGYRILDLNLNLQNLSDLIQDSSKTGDSQLESSRGTFCQCWWEVQDEEV